MNLRRRLTIDISVTVPDDCEHDGVMEQAKDALRAARSTLLGIPGARFLTSGVSVGPVIRRLRRRRVARRRIVGGSDTVN
jgi:hypothetical protein